VLGQFSEKAVTARQRYRKFVADGLADHGRPWKKLVGQVFLGSESFVSRMEELLGDKREIIEIPRAQRYPGRPPLNRLFADTPVADRQQRNQRVVESHISYGYTLKEIADFLGVHYTTISKVVACSRKK
jgi:putative transposase